MKRTKRTNSTVHFLYFVFFLHFRAFKLQGIFFFFKMGFLFRNLENIKNQFSVVHPHLFAGGLHIIVNYMRSRFLRRHFWASLDRSDIAWQMANVRRKFQVRSFGLESLSWVSWTYGLAAAFVFLRGFLQIEEEVVAFVTSWLAFIDCKFNSPQRWQIRIASHNEYIWWPRPSDWQLTWPNRSILFVS